MDGTSLFRHGLVTLLLAAALGMTTGCGETGSPVEKTKSQAVAKEVEPPDQVITALLEALKRGDREAVESLISPTARQEMPKYGFRVEPLGTPEGRFKINQVEYPKDKPGMAYVGSVWQEPMPDGTFQTDNVVWVTKQQQDGQWRVAAMAVEGPRKELVLLDFERPAEMEKEMARLSALYAQQQVPPTPPENQPSSATPPAASTAQQPNGGGPIR